MDFFGLDIGSSSIKIVQLRKEKNKLILANVGEAFSPQPGIRGETEEHWAQTAEAIKKLIADLKLRANRAVISLPEYEVISRLKWFPPMKEGEVKAALEFEAETFIPHPLNKVEIDYEIIEKDENGRLLVFIVAALKKTIEKHLRVAQMANVVSLALETPAVSLARVLNSGETPTLILDLGAQYSSLTASKGGNVFLTRTVPLGSNAFFRSVGVALGMETNVAEKYVWAYGLKEEELEGKVKRALMVIFTKLADEVKKTAYSFKEEWQEEIRLLTLTGGGALIPDLVEEFAKIIGLEVHLAQPFINVEMGGKFSVDVNKKGARFSVAFGLAARNLI